MYFQVNERWNCVLFLFFTIIRRNKPLVGMTSPRGRGRKDAGHGLRTRAVRKIITTNDIFLHDRSIIGYKKRD